MSAFGGKADIGLSLLQCPLLTQSGHGYAYRSPALRGSSFRPPQMAEFKFCV